MYFKHKHNVPRLTGMKTFQIQAHWSLPAFFNFDRNFLTRLAWPCTLNIKLFLTILQIKQCKQHKPHKLLCQCFFLQAHTCNYVNIICLPFAKKTFPSIDCSNRNPVSENKFNSLWWIVSNFALLSRRVSYYKLIIPKREYVSE